MTTNRTITEQLAAATDRIRTKLTPKAGASITLPEQLAAIEAAEAALQNPNALTDARARITQLETELAAARNKIADTGERVNALVEEQHQALSAEVVSLRKQVSDLQAKEQNIETRAATKAREICASVGVTMPANADTDKSALKDGGNSKNLTGLAAVVDNYNQTIRSWGKGR